MKLIALEIPENPAELAGWLDRQIVGDDLAALVAELEAIHGNHPEAQRRTWYRSKTFSVRTDPRC